MIRAFNMVCDTPSQYASWVSQGRQYFEQSWPKRSRELDAFVRGGEIAGDGLKKHWFADVHPHVFISHSHGDEELAMGLAGYLEEIGIQPFVDSLVWGDSRDLLRAIDEEFCLNEPERKTYSYRSRNYSTSHVHMMLASALADAIDRSDAVIFLNTPNSIEARSAKNAGDEVTASPWIYHELVTTRIVRERGYQGRQRMKPALESFDHKLEKRAEASFKVLHKPPMAHLVKLGYRDLELIRAAGLTGLDALDRLYQNTDPRVA